MKKFFLSFFVIASFGLYAFGIRPNAGTSSYKANTVTEAVQNIPAQPTPLPVATAPSKPPVIVTKKGFTDGTFTGNSVDAYYGMVQVKAIIKNGKLSDVVFLDYPQDRSTSLWKSLNAMPILKQEAIATQSSKVNMVSGATDTSRAFVKSLASALSQAIG